MEKKGVLNSYNWRPYAFASLGLHVAGLVLLLIASREYPVMLGLGFVAYTLGLRHAFDADHIAAIDNTVRKLIQQKRNPVGVGFFFSLGHSTVVFLMAVILGLSVRWAERHLPVFQHTGGLIGATVSGVFLIFIAILNLVILFDLQKLFLKLRHQALDESAVENLLLSRGLMSRAFKPLFKLISRSWHVYPLGFLFGLGFDTASEVALLALSAGAAKSAMPFIGILSLPLLFAAGMNLMDTLDGIMMSNAYKWAFDTPVRKVYYNLTITAVSVAAALLIGGVELAQVMTEQFGWKGALSSWIQGIDFNWLGYGLILLFLLFWLVSYGIWKIFRIEEKWTSRDV